MNYTMKEYLQNKSNKNRNLKRPDIVGYMSVDVNRHYHLDLSQLKYVNPGYNEINFLDLNHNLHTAVKRTTDENNEKIDLLLRFLRDNYSYVSKDEVPNFFTYRRTLISIMCSRYGVSESLHFTASYYKGSIYLCSVESEQDILRRQNRSPQEQIFCAWGYKFEQYMLSDSPKSKPNINTPVIENEEFSIFYKSTLGEHTLVYGAQIDGLLTEDSNSETPKTCNFDSNINYLKMNKFCELKTNREIQHYKQERNFKRYKLLRCWCQCYLANLTGLLVGFRNDVGVVQRLQWYDTDELPRYCKNEWNPQSTIDFLHQTLSYVRKCFENCPNADKPVTYKFIIDASREIYKTDITPQEEILPSWYTETIPPRCLEKENMLPTEVRRASLTNKPTKKYCQGGHYVRPQKCLTLTTCDYLGTKIKEKVRLKMYL